MALKGHRTEREDNIQFFMNEVANRGGIVCVSTGGSGISLDQSAALATVKATSSGSKALGMLLNDMVNVDLTRQRLNDHKDEVQIGNKVTIARKGYFVTDQIVSGTSPAAGDGAYLGAEGRITPTDTGSIASPKVGQFLSAKDEDGYAEVSINL